MVENWHHHEVLFRDEKSQHKYVITYITVRCYGNWEWGENNGAHFLFCIINELFHLYNIL